MKNRLVEQNFTNIDLFEANKRRGDMRINEKIMTGVLMGLIFTAPLFAQKKVKPVLTLKTITEREFAMNAISGTWQLSAIMDYDYNTNGKQVSLVKYDAAANDSISRVDYTYTSAGLLNDYVVSLWDGDAWRPDTKYSYTYTAEGKAGQRILRWNGEVWTVSRLDTLFQYDLNGLLIQSENFRWKNNEWQKDHTIHYENSPTGKLALKYSISEAGEYLSRVFYLYDAYDRLCEMYAQFYREGSWDNGWRRVYSYDRCSVLKSLVRQSWDGEKWVDILMSEYEHSVYWNGPSNGKVNICYNGNSMTVSVNVLDVFLKKGACIGVCETELLPETDVDTEEKSGTMTEAPYTVFPNPASDLFTIRSVDGLTMIGGVELITMKGEVVRSLRYDDIPEATVNIDDLRPGRYFVVISGDANWSSSIVVR